TGFDFLQSPPTALDLLKNILRSRRPDERLWVAVPFLNEFLDCRYQIWNAGETTASHGFAGELGGAAFHHVQPAGTCGNEVDLADGASASVLPGRYYEGRSCPSPG